MVFNQGVVTPRGSVEVLQGIPKIVTIFHQNNLYLGIFKNLDKNYIE